MPTRTLIFLNRFLGGGFLESEKSNMAKPKKTASGKYKCPADNQEYNTKEDYEAHCMEEHPGGM